MYRSRILSSVATAALFLAMPVGLTLGTAVMPDTAIAQARAEIDVNFFFGELEPHGSWARHDRHRYVWVPDRVDRDWAPYTQGRWAYVEAVGWTFVSDEPFAWATYHYGRWDYDRAIGWFWVPGTKWAPAWVSWRRGPDYVGWAPLPPERDGFAVSLEINVRDVPEERWFFVPVREFTAPRLSVVLVPVRERPVIYQRTEYLGPVVVQNNIVVNLVLDFDFIRERSDREIVVNRIERVGDPQQARAAEAGGTIQVFAPEVAEPTADAAPSEVVEVEAIAAERAEQGVAPAAEAEAGAAANTEAEATSDAPAAEATEPSTATTSETTGDQPAEATTETTGEADSGTAAGADAEAADSAPAAEAEAEAEAEANGEAGASTEAPAEVEAEAEAEVGAEAGASTEAPAEEAATEPATTEPAAEEPAADEPAASEPAATEPAAEAPAAADEPVASEAPAAEAPAAAAEQPAAEQPAEEPAAEQPAAGEAPAQPCTAEQQANGTC